MRAWRSIRPFAGNKIPPLRKGGPGGAREAQIFFPFARCKRRARWPIDSFPQCKQAEQNARPDRCCDRVPRTLQARRAVNREAGYLFFADFLAPFLAFVDFLAFFVAISRDSCHSGFGCQIERKRSCPADIRRAGRPLTSTSST